MNAHPVQPDRLTWSYLLHLGYNMWEDRDASEQAPDRAGRFYSPRLRCDKAVWDEIVRQLAEAGANQVVIDLGEGVQYESHPEIAVEGSWPVSRLKDEIGAMRELGLEPIPKLNFSTAHDTWLGPYARCVSTPTYYEVCRNLIHEVIDIFDTPRLFHLGMDEETPQHQRWYAYLVVRQYELWWHDLLFYVEQVEQRGVRPWVWSDYLWHHPEPFFKHMPRSVMQSNWYYRMDFDPEQTHVKAFLDLEAHGYDQIPTGSTHVDAENLPRMVEFCLEHISPERLHGFLQTPWKPTIPERREHHRESVDALARARRVLEAKSTSGGSAG